MDIPVRRIATQPFRIWVFRCFFCRMAVCHISPASVALMSFNFVKNVTAEFKIVSGEGIHSLGDLSQ